MGTPQDHSSGKVLIDSASSRDPLAAPRQGTDNTGGYPREGGFVVERGIGHVPGQRWSGGYGGDGGAGEGPTNGQGFTGNDFVTTGRGPHYGKGPKGYTRSDARIQDDVCEAIAEQGEVDASDVEVKVVSGTVILSGTVGHRNDQRALERIVQGIRGVLHVRNDVQPIGS